LEIRYRAADFLITLKRYHEAMAVLDEGLVHAPEHPRLLCARGTVLNNLGRYEDVLTNEDRLLKVNPGHVHSYFNKGTALIGLRLISEADTIAGFMVEIAPNYPCTWILVGDVALAQGKAEDALKAYSKTLQLEPNDKFAGYRKAEVLSQLLRFDEAIVEYDRVLEIDPRHAHARLYKAHALAALGQSAKAAEICASLIEIDSSEHMLLHVAELLHSLGKDAEALQLTDRLLEQEVGSAKTWAMRAHIEIAMSQYAKAAKSARRARELGATDPGSGLSEAIALVGAEGFGAGLKALERALGEVKALAERDELAIDIWAMIDVEMRLRGVVAMARQMYLLRDALAQRGETKILATALTELAKAVITDEELAPDEWITAMPFLQDALADIPECKIPLDMLSVVSRYRKTGDKGVLLELPLEQRMLIPEANEK
jgi:tetratricopeptide (TPR) repeat protein